MHVEFSLNLSTRSLIMYDAVIFTEVTEERLIDSYADDGTVTRMDQGTASIPI